MVNQDHWNNRQHIIRCFQSAVFFKTPRVAWTTPTTRTTFLVFHHQQQEQQEYHNNHYFGGLSSIQLSLESSFLCLLSKVRFSLEYMRNQDEDACLDIVCAWLVLNFGCVINPLAHHWSRQGETYLGQSWKQRDIWLLSVHIILYCNWVASKGISTNREK